VATTPWGALRHACTGCGGSCQSVGVVPLGDDERARVRRHAAALGVEDPIDVTGALRRVGGSCVFLDAQDRCRIHATFGGTEKPSVCQQFPVVATRVGDDVRVGLDPACYAQIGTWRSAPELDVGRLVVAPAPLPEAFVDVEQQVLSALRGARRPEQALAALFGGDADALVDRLRARFRAADLPALVAAGDVGPRLGEALRDVDLDGPPSPLDETTAAFATDAAARVVWLRLGRPIDHPAVVAALVLSLSILASAGAPAPDRFGARLAGLLRALRSPVVLGRLFPTPTSLREWLTGA
jgi:Fe-S-cluster containining protein